MNAASLSREPNSEPVRLIEIVAEEVGTPRNDGTPGCALYRVPIRISRTPSAEWARLFAELWDTPPSFSTRHRPGIGRVVGDRIILDGTTVEEIEQVHRETLRIVVDRVNAVVAGRQPR